MSRALFVIPQRLLSVVRCNQVSLITRHSSKMSEQQQESNIVKGADSWFNKYTVVENSPEGTFKGVKDRFNGITVDSNMETCSPDSFPTVLKRSLEHWIHSKNRGIWFKVHLSAACWIPELVNNGFQFHHAKNTFVMLYRWLPTTESANIPPYSHTMVGVGALVMNDRNQVLVVSENYALIAGSWKLPGGYVEPNENFIDAAIREVMEETNVRTKFDSVVSIRHAHGAGFGCSDLYIVMALTPLTHEISKCNREIAKCEWMDVNEYLAHPKVHETNRNFVRTYLEYKRLGVRIDCTEEMHQVLKKRYNIYSVAKVTEGCDSVESKSSSSSSSINTLKL
uniref:Nudix hydrolase domain-containing protein n=1 Tax=Anopheles farauti TaxID=69004 RepID=A0A182PZY3_9DIPT